MDDVDYLVEDNPLDEFFAYHQKWMGPMVGPRLKMIWPEITEKGSPWLNGTMAVQARNKMQMLGMILVTGEEPNNKEWIHYLKRS